MRQIDVWEIATGMEPSRRGVKLRSRLEGDAIEKMELVDPKSLNVEHGVAMFKKLIRQKYEPLEKHRVGQIMDEFMYTFSRSSGESIMDYSIWFGRELDRAEKVAGELTSL